MLKKARLDELRRKREERSASKKGKTIIRNSDNEGNDRDRSKSAEPQGTIWLKSKTFSTSSMPTMGMYNFGTISSSEILIRYLHRIFRDQSYHFHSTALIQLLCRR